MCSTTFVAIAMTIILLTNRCSKKNKLLLWWETFIMLLSVPQPLKLLIKRFPLA